MFKSITFPSAKISTTKQQQPPNISNHLLELQREIKEEEDEIFADINSLINNRSNLYSSFDDDDTDDLYDHDQSTNNHEEKQLPQQQQQQQQQFQQQKLFGLLGAYEVQTNHQDGLVQLERQDEPQQEQHQDENQNEDKPLNESIQQVQTEADDYQSMKRDIHQLTSNLPKPCVFFLEGNCRRSDCKYSHDLSSITCKYWIEGFCFKGEMCPFLHSFPPKDQDLELLEDLNLNKKELNPTFVIESETDFPSLPLDAPELNLVMGAGTKSKVNSVNLTKTIKNQVLSSNPAVVFKTTKKKRKKG